MFTAPAHAQYKSILEAEQLEVLLPLLRQHPALSAAETSLRAQQSRLRAARTVGRPSSLFINAEEVATDALERSNMTLGIDHEFTPAAERRAEVALSQADIRLAEARLNGIQLSLASSLDRVVLATVVNRQITRRLAAEDSLLERAGATLNARFSVGDARYVDVIRLRTERLRVQADLLEAESRIARATAELRGLVSQDVSIPKVEAIAVRLPEISPNIDSLVQNSPAARVAAANELRTRALIDVARARGAHTWRGSLGVQRFPSEDGSSRIGPAIGASVTLPIFNRRAQQLAVDAAALDSAAARLSSQAATTSLISTMRSAYAQIDATKRSISAVNQQLILAAREERESALIAYANRELTLVELLDFERSLSRSEIALLEAYLTAVVVWDELNQVLAGASALAPGDTQ